KLGHGVRYVSIRTHRSDGPRYRDFCAPPRLDRQAAAVQRAQRAALASATVSAVMLTMRRTVADGVRMCTGLAAPSKTGPIAMPPPAACLSRLYEMFAASMFGSTSRLASPVSVLPGITSFR